jgi:peptidylprolyl isomerase
MTDQSKRVFLDLEVGDRDEAARQDAAYQRAKEFLATVRHQYGWPDTLDELGDEEKEIFVEAYASDPSWSARGAPRLRGSESIRGRLEIVLYSNAAPKTVENFRCLCTGERGKGKASGKALHYRGTRMHRVVKDFVVQGGDVVKGDGSGGDSIYTGGAFKDEKGGLALKHDGVGVVAMANSGPHTNRSQFYITLAPQLPQCDGKHVVFGRVLNASGLDLLRYINDHVASESGDPLMDVYITECGEL